MSKQERMRELVAATLEPERIRQRTEEGWTLVALEWQRDVPGEEGNGHAFLEEVPFGTQVADDCLHLVENPNERQVLVLMMDLIVQDQPLSTVARELNVRGFRTRDSKAWSQAAVFNLLPRLVEVGPRIFSSEEWEARQRRVLAAR